LALANVAVTLASAGRRVPVVDFDFEIICGLVG